MRESAEPTRVEEKIKSMTEFIPVRDDPDRLERKEAHNERK